LVLWLCLLLVAAGCQSTVAPTEPPAVGVVNNANEPTPTAAAGDLVEIAPYPLDQTTGPIRLQIPEINLSVPVIAMGWRVDVVDGQRTTVWDVPFEEAGWHINSAGAGGLGNTLISGRQVGGAAVFAPLALGSVVVGQRILLTDGDGIVFVYEVIEVTAPVAVTGATAEETAQADAYFAPTSTARLTLVTGWPEFTTTHRIFTVAEFKGVLR
jgi:sortase (surface protein transpeptidase)